MADELQWAGAWRKKSASDGIGMVSGIKVGVGSGPAASPSPERAAPRSPSGGKVEGTGVSAEQIKQKDAGEPVRGNGRARLNRS